MKMLEVEFGKEHVIVYQKYLLLTRHSTAVWKDDNSHGA